MQMIDIRECFIDITYQEKLLYFVVKMDIATYLDCFGVIFDFYLCNLQILLDQFFIIRILLDITKY